MSDKGSIKLYRGYGHQKNLVMYGHAFEWKAKRKQEVYSGSIANMIHLLKMFMVRPYPYAKVRLKVMGREMETTAEEDGFFKFRWVMDEALQSGWYKAEAFLLSDQGAEVAFSESDVWVPDKTQLAFISDIDDTVLISHSATILKRMRELLAKNPYKRRLFSSAAKWYQLLSFSATVKDMPNPFFYVSSSEWNLYDNIRKIFEHNQLPNGVFLLSHLKRFKDVFKTGKTRHEAKKDRIARILRIFPNQKFVLIGDNSQRDPVIYSAIAEEFPGRVYAVFIRDVRKKKRKSTTVLMDMLAQKGIKTNLFRHNTDAIAYSKEIGLI